MPNDITDATSAVVFNDTDEQGISPKDIPLENTSKPAVTSGLDGHSAIDKLFQGTSAPAKTDEESEEVPEKEEVTENETVEKDEAPEKKDEPKKETAEEAKKKADEAAAAKPSNEPKDKLAEVKLPPFAKPGTVKSFDEVKRRARDEIAARDAKIKELEAKVPKDGAKLPEQVEKELNELREFRKVHDYQNDTEFKKNFVEPIEANNTSILKKLEGVGFTKEQLEQIKEIGVDKLDWDPIYEKHPQLRRSIEALLLDNERVSEKKSQALEQAKNAPKDFVEKQKKADEDRRIQEETTVKQVVDATLAKLEWYKEIAVPANATAEQKAEIEAKNAFHKEQTSRLNLLLADNSPEMRGQMVAATLLAYQKQAEANDYKARWEKADAELKKFRKASSTRSTRNAPAPSDVPPPKMGLLVSGRDALDSLHKSVTNAE